jgi:hypothetical protein
MVVRCDVRRGGPRLHAMRLKGEDDREGEGVSLAKRYQEMG